MSTSSVTEQPVLTAAPPGVQRRILGLLMVTQVIGGMGNAIGIAVGALLAATLGGTAISGLGQSSLVVGAALLAVPVSRVMRARGRRPGLVLAYGVGALGGLIVVVGAARHSLPLVFTGLFLFGGGSAANYQARYSAVDLASPSQRGRHLSWVVWATTIGAVAGPNLAPAADRLAHGYGAATYSGPFVFSAVAFLLAAAVILLLMRPDPLLLARRLAGAAAAPSTASVAGPATVTATAAAPVSGPAPARTGLAAAAREVAGSPAARLGIAAVAMGHLVMIGVMSMTPVHIGQSGHGDSLRIVSFVLSVHIAGMYAFSPIAGWLTDRVGRRPVILGGVALLLAACAVAGSAGHDTARLSFGLALLGMGWSGTMVAGSILLSESVGPANRPSVQGLSDLVMGLAAASSGALSGVIVAWSSYATLTLLAAVATVPLIALTIRPVRLASS